MDLIDKQHGMRITFQLLEHRLKPLLEITSVFGSCQQRAHIQGIDRGVFQNVRDIFFNNSSGQALRDRSLAHTGFAHKKRIIFPPPA